MRIQVIKSGQVVHSLRLEGRPLAIGRAPDNDLILTSAEISSHHALCFFERDQFRVRDLGSTNGTFLNGTRITEEVLKVGDVLRVGDVELQTTESVARPVGFQIVQVDGPVAFTVEHGFPVPGHPSSMLYVEEDGVFLDLDGSVRQLVPGETFELGTTSFALEATLPTAQTVPLDGRLPYRLEVDLQLDQARLTAPDLEPVEVTASTRVALLYVLGRETGWVADDAIGSGVWGRAWVRNDPNNLNVLLHRLRHQVHRGGYDKRFVERRRGAMRLNVETVVVR